MPPVIDTAAAAAATAQSSDRVDKASPESAASSPTIKKRAHRVSRACDFCHSRSIRCRPSDSNSSSCQSCIEYDRRCTYDRPSRKRGVKSHPARAAVSLASSSSFAAPNIDPSTVVASLVVPESLTTAMITDLVEIYFEIVYPIFPFFHRQTLLRRISRAEHSHDRAFFGALMALCGLTSARMRDGAPYSRKCSPELFSDKMPSPRAFLELGEVAIPKEPRAGESIDHLRNCALLAILSIQDGDDRQTKYFIGLFHTLVQLEGMDKESNWPQILSQIEQEERRRLFWSMYMLELSSAMAFDSSIASREAHTSIAYPTEVDDEDLTDENPSPPKRSSPSASSASISSTAGPSWLVGWTFAVDLYRILEHALDRQRSLASGAESVKARSLFHAHETSNETIFNDLLVRYEALPRQFKEIRNLAFNPREDRFGFQAANIAATIQLVRMILFTTESSTVQVRVRIVQEVLHTFSEVPMGYLKAMSMPLLHNLASIGILLGQTLQGSLIEDEHSLIRAALLEMVSLLTSLGTGAAHGDGPSRRLRTQIERMDLFVHSQKPGVPGAPSVMDQMFQMSRMQGLEETTPGSLAQSSQQPSHYGELAESQDAPLFNEHMMSSDWPWPYNYSSGQNK